MDLPDRFARDGYAIVRGAVAGEELARLRTAFDALMGSGSAAAVLQLPRPSERSPIVRAHLTSPACGGVAADALGAAAIQLLQDGLLLKRARPGSRIEWHQDYSYTGYVVPPCAVSVRLALTPSTLETGCLQVLSGSHAWSADAPLDLSAQSIGAGALDELPEPWRSRASDSQRALELLPGDVSVHHCRTYHASGENRGDRDAKIIVVHAFDAACTLAPERLPSPEAAAWFPTDADGHLSTERFPLLWPPASPT